MNGYRQRSRLRTSRRRPYDRCSEPANILGNTTFKTYDPLGNVVAEWGATYPVRYAYDTQNRRTSLTTFRTTGGSPPLATDGDTTMWTYDPATGNYLSKTYADNSQVLYTYTPDNLPLRTTYASGRWKENVYDSQRRLTGMLYSSPDMDYELQLDEYGRTTQASNGVTQTAYVLNSAGGATNEGRMTDNAVDTIARTFDGADRLTGLSLYGRGYEQCLAYSTNGLLSTISNSDAVVAYDYSGDLKDMGYAIVFSDGGMFTRMLRRDPFRRDLVLSITNTCGLSSHGIDYSYDAVSRPVSRNGDTFAYNGCSEVANAIIGGNLETHEYDSIGNSLLATFNAETNTYTVNNVNQYTSVLCDSVSLRETNYDTDGNLTNDGVFSYSYDAANRLVSVSSNGTVLVSNLYDHRGRRVRKTTPISTTTFLYDDWNLIYEREMVGTTTNETFYYWGKDLSGTLQGAGGVGGLLYLKRNGTIYVPHADAMGNILRYTDTAGNVVAAYTYDAFGKTISASGSLAHIFRLRFSTKYFDAETGLYYYGYRFYHPVLMRWLNRDPIGERGGLNLYSFCNNAQLFKIDADGYSIFNYLPFTSTLLSAIESYIGHIPGSSVTDYSVVSPRDCRCGFTGAEEQCIEKIERETLQYIVNNLSSAVLARVTDFVVFAGTLRADSRVSAAFFADGILGAAINAHIYSKIMDGANKAKSENCSCSHYGYYN